MPGVLLRDDFGDPTSGWPRETADPATRRIGYVGGAYVVTLLPGTGGAVFVAHARRFGDFQAAVDAQLTPATVGGYLFLDFRRQDQGDCYSFLLDPVERALLLLRRTDGRHERLIDWTPSAVIRPGAALNRLEVRPGARAPAEGEWRVGGPLSRPDAWRGPPRSGRG